MPGGRSDVGVDRTAEFQEDRGPAGSDSDADTAAAENLRIHSIDRCYLALNQNGLDAAKRSDPCTLTLPWT